MRELMVGGYSGSVDTKVENVGLGLESFGKGTSAMGEGLAEMGQELKRTGLKIQDVSKAAGNVSKKANMALTKNQIAFVQADMQREFDQTNIENSTSLNTDDNFARTKATYDHFQQMIENADETEKAPLTTEARNHLKKALEGFKTQSVQNYTISRSKAEASVALNINQGIITDSILNKDRDTLVGAAQLGVETGLYTQSQGEYLVTEGALNITSSETAEFIDEYRLEPYVVGETAVEGYDPPSINEMTGYLDQAVSDAEELGVTGVRLEKLITKRDVAVERINKQTAARASDILALKSQGRTSEAMEKVKSMPEGALKTNLENDLLHTRPSNYMSSIGSQIAYAQNLTELKGIEADIIPELTDLEAETLRRRFIAKRATLRGGVGKKDAEKIYKAIESGKLTRESLKTLGLSKRSLETAEALADREDLEAEMELFETRSIVSYDAIRPYLAQNSTVYFDFVDEQESVDYVKDKLGEAERSTDNISIRLTRDFEARGDDANNKITKGPNTLKGKYAVGYLEAHILSLKAGPVKDKLLSRLQGLLSNDGTHLYTFDGVVKSTKDLNVINSANNTLEAYAKVSSSMSPSEQRRDRNEIYELIVGVSTGSVELEQASMRIETIKSRASHLQALDALRYSFNPTVLTQDTRGPQGTSQYVEDEVDPGILF